MRCLLVHLSRNPRSPPDMHRIPLQDAQNLGAWGAEGSDFVLELEDAPPGHAPHSGNHPPPAGLEILEGLAAM